MSWSADENFISNPRKFLKQMHLTFVQLPVLFIVPHWEQELNQIKNYNHRIWYTGYMHIDNFRCLFDKRLSFHAIFSFENTYNHESFTDSIHSTSSSSHRPISSSTQMVPHDDSDFEVEVALPALEEVLAKDVLKKLKPKEKKRQDVINGELSMNRWLLIGAWWCHMATWN